MQWFALRVHPCAQVGDVVCEIELEQFSVGVKVETPGFLAEICEWSCAASAVMFFTIYFYVVLVRNPSIARVNRSNFLAPGSSMTGSSTREFLHISWLSVVFAILPSRAACGTLLFWASCIHIAAPLYVRSTVVQDSCCYSSSGLLLFVFVCSGRGRHRGRSCWVRHWHHRTL